MHLIYNTKQKIYFSSQIKKKKSDKIERKFKIFFSNLNNSNNNLNNNHFNNSNNKNNLHKINKNNFLYILNPNNKKIISLNFKIKINKEISISKISLNNKQLQINKKLKTSLIFHIILKNIKNFNRKMNLLQNKKSIIILIIIYILQLERQESLKIIFLKELMDVNNKELLLLHKRNDILYTF